MCKDVPRFREKRRRISRQRIEGEVTLGPRKEKDSDLSCSEWKSGLRAQAQTHPHKQKKTSSPSTCRVRVGVKRRDVPTGHHPVRVR